MLEDYNFCCKNTKQYTVAEDGTKQEQEDGAVWIQKEKSNDIITFMRIMAQSVMNVNGGVCVHISVIDKRHSIESVWKAYENFK